MERIQRYRFSGNDRQKRMIPAEEGRLKRLRQKFGERIAELRLKEEVSAHDSMVSGGLIRII